MGAVAGRRAGHVLNVLEESGAVPCEV